MNLNKYILIIIAAVISLQAFALNDIDYKAKADSAMFFYSSGEYSKCIDVAMSVNKGYPFRDYEKKSYYETLAYGAMSIHSLQLSYDKKAKELYLQKFRWAADACNYFNELLKIKTKYLVSTQSVVDYYVLLELAFSTYSSIVDMTDGVTKQYDKMASNWIKSAYKSTFKKRHEWDDNAYARLYILENAITVLSNSKSIYQIDDNIINEFWDAIDYAVDRSEKEVNQAYLIFASGMINSISSIYRHSIYDKHSDNCKTLDFSLKARDFNLYAIGAQRFRNFRNVNWKQIQSHLGDNELCMEHFEGHIMPGMLYAGWDETTRYRNFAFIFDKHSSEPEFWSRGYRNNIEKQGIQKILETHTGIKTIYSTGTKVMDLKDYAGVDGITYRLHSLSTIAKKIERTDDSKNPIFIGEINYTLGEEEASKGVGLKGAVKREYYHSFVTDSLLKESFLSSYGKNACILNGDNVTPAQMIKALTSSNIVHISTHGKFDQTALSKDNEILDINAINGANVLKNCKLLLSSYNDNQRCFIDGYTISRLNLNHISLLFLYACQTADGRKVGIGAYSLAEAFHIAGVNNIIATLDPIDPQITLDFSNRFYGLVKDGMSYHDAFYQSKRELCPNERIILWE